MTNWKHDELQADLAAHLRATRDRVVWENMQLGPMGSPRPDVYTIPKSFTQFKPLAYEIKISVSDFRRDVTAGKWQSYLKFASGVTFAAPAGLIGKADLPAGCGLVVRGEEGWKTLKAPTLRVCETLPRDAWMKLIIDGIERQNSRPHPDEFNQYVAQHKIAQRFGERAAHLICELATGAESLEYRLAEMRKDHQQDLDRARARHQLTLQHEHERAGQQAQQISAEIMLLEEALGLPIGSGAWDMIHALAQARQRLSLDHELNRLNRILSNVRRQVAEIA